MALMDKTHVGDTPQHVASTGQHVAVFTLLHHPVIISSHGESFNLCILSSFFVLVLAPPFLLSSFFLAVYFQYVLGRADDSK